MKSEAFATHLMLHYAALSTYDLNIHNSRFLNMYLLIYSFWFDITIWKRIKSTIEVHYYKVYVWYKGFICSDKNISVLIICLYHLGYKYYVNLPMVTGNMKTNYGTRSGFLFMLNCYGWWWLWWQFKYKKKMENAH